MKILVLLLIAAIVSELTMSFLARAARHFPLNPGGGREIVLRYADTLKLAAIVFPTAVFLMLAVPLFKTGLAGIESSVLTLALILSITLIGIAVALEAFFKRVLLDEEGVQLLGVFGNGAIPWKEIESVTYNRWLKMFTIHSWDGARLRINPSLSGIGFFEALLWERVDEARFRQARQGFMQVARDSR